MSTAVSDIMQGKVCAYCNQPTVYVDSAEVYNGRSYGMIYRCRPCDAHVGVHKDTDVALGRVADAKLRVFKKQAHDAFDPLWRRKAMRALIKKEYDEKHKVFQSARKRAYAWLAKAMGIDPDLCHIGMFDIDQCLRVIELCRPFIETQTQQPTVSAEPKTNNQ